jgi:hypothetical protein
MAQTLYLHRLIVTCPVAALAALGAWWQANLDPVDDLSTWPSLNPSGDPAQPETHRWISTALTVPQWRAVVVKVCQLASVTPPTVAVWNGWTAAQQKAWLVSTRDQLFAATGVWLDLSENDGPVWNDPEAVLATLGLKRRQAAH